jgi:hypothetical protein
MSWLKLTHLPRADVCQVTAKEQKKAALELKMIIMEKSLKTRRVQFFFERELFLVTILKGLVNQLLGIYNYM